MWHEYAKVLYGILGQPPLTHTHCSHPHESALFTPQNVRNAIDRLQFGKAQDHDGLVGKHFIYARDILLPLLAILKNELYVKVSLLDGLSIPLCQSSRVETPLCQETIGQSWLATTWLNNMARFKNQNWVYGQSRMVAVQLDKQASERGSQLWTTYWPYEPLSRREEPIIRGFIVALWNFCEQWFACHLRILV